MKILFCSVEIAPDAKVGGLADVAMSLPKALKERGHEIINLVPAYGLLTKGLKPILSDLKVEVIAGKPIHASIFETQINGVKTWLVGTKDFFLQTERSEDIYAFGAEAYLLLAQAVLAVCERFDFIPDVVHANDWHTGFVPVFLREKGGDKFKNTACTYTIHNLAYQGNFGPEIIELAGLKPETYTSEKLENWGGVNFLKSACVYADQINTVSETYAKEILTEEYGAGQWGVLRDLDRLGKLRGIVNGIDYESFDPTSDPDIASHFNAEDLTGKAACKAALQNEFGFKIDAEKPLIGIVSRLSDQKGYDLILRQAYGMLALGAQFIALGTGDPWSASELRKLQAEWPEQVAFAERYDGPLAQRIYAGSDLFLMPSAFEPCGLGQMIACRYGTLPIVRQTGGLADTIRDGENGFVFVEKTAKKLFDTIAKAISTFEDKQAWNGMVKTAMATDFSWKTSAAKYEAMYEEATASRRGSALIEA